MQKQYSIINNYFSLIKNQINSIAVFNKTAEALLLKNDLLFFDVLTNSIWRKDLLTFSQKVMAIVEKVSNLNNNYLENLHLLANILEVLIKVNIDESKD